MVSSTSFLELRESLITEINGWLLLVPGRAIPPANNAIKNESNITDLEICRFGAQPSLPVGAIFARRTQSPPILNGVRVGGISDDFRISASN